MIKKIISTILLILLFVSCASYSTSLKNDWSEEYFFKEAQQAYDKDNLSESLFYYQVYLLRYPQNHTKGIAAEYERAYILYKQKEYNLSEQYFNIILEKYESNPYSYLYPKAYKVLSEKVLEQIIESRAIAALPFYKRGKAIKFGLESVQKEELKETDSETQS